MKKLLYTILLLSLTACSSLGIGGADPTAAPAPAEIAPLELSGVVAEGHLEPAESRYLAFAQPGRVDEILVEAGQQVEAGQALARLENSEEAQARLDGALLEVAAAQQALDDLQRTTGLAHHQAWAERVRADQALVQAQKAWDAIDTQATEDELEDARTAVADAQKELNDAQADFEPYKDLPEDNSQRKEAQSTLDDAEQAYSDAVLKRDEIINARALAEANLALAKSQQAEAVRRFERTDGAVDPDALNLAELRLQSAESAQAAAQAALDNLTLEAPFAGTVIDINVLPGELTGTSNWAILLADTNTWYVRTSDLTELEVVRIELGQEAELVPDALPELVLDGVVVEISDTYRTQTGDILYDVRLSLDAPDPRLKWGMTFEITFSD